VELVKLQKDNNFSNTIVFKTTEFVASKHLSFPKPEYSAKPYYFSKNPKRLCIQTGL
jgi:hypothetical protein